LLAIFVVNPGILPADQELPLWEAGIGVFPATFPSFRGSDNQEYYLLPLPYLVYRGDILKVDREGIRAELFESDRVHLNISMNGSVPVESENDDARSGMPDLDPTFEIGPSLNITLASTSPSDTVSLRLPVRAVIATDFSSAERAGWIFHPHVNLERKAASDAWNLGLSIGPLFATEAYHSYYYEVKSAYATPERPVYKTSSGYSGTAMLASISRNFNSFWAGGFVRYDYLSGATFDDSPLVNTDHSLMAGFAVVWKFAKSDRTVIE
jgi:outer membrane protein